MRKSLIGKRFGRLVVIDQGVSTKQGRRTWICQCDCGKVCSKNKLTNTLERGDVKSCGCLRQEVTAKHGKENVVHGMSGTRLHQIWCGMKQRCYYSKGNQYDDYGGRGITVCEEWKNSFDLFKRWATKNGYRKELTIDRTDTNGNYNPGNCRWATWTEQENNRRNNRIIEVNERKNTLAMFARENNISAACLRSRILSGWSKEEWFIKPDLNNKNIRERGVRTYQ